MYRSKLKKIKRQKRWLSPNLKSCVFLVAMILLVWVCAAAAEDYKHLPDIKIDSGPLKVGLDTMWVLFTACLVFFMNAGFAMLEAGFCRPKNTVNILAKNLIVFGISTLAFLFFGFGVMFGDGNGFMGLNGVFLLGQDNSPSTGKFYEGVFSSLNWTSVPLAAKFFFQLVFAGTAATIVSGAVAERIKFLAFLIFSCVLVGLLYPIIGHWVWGGGWLYEQGFRDFAGSTVVHSVGGWAGLVGAWMLGPRLGRLKKENSKEEVLNWFVGPCIGSYSTEQPDGTINKKQDGKVRSEAVKFSGAPVVRLSWKRWFRLLWMRLLDLMRLSHKQGAAEGIIKTRAIPAHNISISTLGCLILWLGWFGFNPGSTMEVNPAAISHIILTTNIAAATGAILATITDSISNGKPDITMIVNGVLAGLVGITASCAYVGYFSAIVIGGLAGILVVFSVNTLEKLNIDDPVGAISVHLVCGILGTLAVGLCADPEIYNNLNVDGPKAAGFFFGWGFSQVVTQLIGILSVGCFTLIGSFLIWLVINHFFRIRVLLPGEEEGLDIGEHGMKAYPYFNKNKLD